MFPSSSSRRDNQIPVLTRSGTLRLICPACGKRFRRWRCQRKPVMFCSQQCWQRTVKALLAAYYAQWLRGQPEAEGASNPIERAQGSLPQSWDGSRPLKGDTRQGS